MEDIRQERFEELTQNTIDLKTSVSGKIQVTVLDSKTGKNLLDKVFAGDLLVKDILNAVSAQTGLKPKVDPGIQAVKNKTIESITDNNIIEFQINQAGVLIMNADMSNKAKTVSAAPLIK